MASNRLPADARSSRRFVGPTGPGGRVPALDNVFLFPCLCGLLRLIYFRRQGLRWREKKNSYFPAANRPDEKRRWASDILAPAPAPSRPRGPAAVCHSARASSKPERWHAP